MSINANQLFPVTAAVINTGTEGLLLAGNFLSTNPLIPINDNQSTLQFNSLADVADFFGTGSTEYAAATNYFLGYNNSFKKPGVIFFTRYIDDDESPILYGSTIDTTLLEFQGMTAVTITIPVDGVNVTTASINLSAASSLSNVGALVLAALITAEGDLADATLVYDGANQRYIFDTGLDDGTGTVGFAAVGTLATAMGLTVVAATDLTITTGAGYLSQGSAELTPAENFENLTKLTQNFASFTRVFSLSEGSSFTWSLAASDWANDNGYMFVQWNTVSVANEIEFKTLLDTSENANVAPNFGSLNVASFVMGTGASIDYTRTNGVISFSYKSQDGLSASVTTDANATALINAFVNFYGSYSNASNNYNFYQQGRITGQFKFIQNFYNQMWLANGIQSSLLSLFANASILGYSSEDYTTIQNTLDDIMLQALNNGVATKGNTFSQTQIALMTQQAGYDISKDMTNNGYYIQIQAVNGDQRAANVPPPTTIWYTNRGVILTLPVTTVFVM